MPKGNATIEEAIAIVGIGGVFPGARTLEEFWKIIEEGVDTCKPVPAGRWILDSKTIQNPAPSTPDRVYTDRGCFIEGFQLDPTGLTISAEMLQTLDPSIHLLLEAGRNALASARMEGVDSSRIGVVLGNIALPTSAVSELSQDLAASANQTEKSPLNRYVCGLPAGLLAQALGLGGGTCTLDAACASSLYALKLACDELLAGRTDAMLAGGLSRPDSLYTQMGFCQLRALSQTGRCAPFDEEGTGLIVGEGAGVLTLKRLSDALRQGDQIHAVIRGIGLSNDLDGNLLSPSSEGQLRALKQAYQQAGWSPDQVDLIECHATGTPVGDAVEFESLSKLWNGSQWQPGQCVLGAVKANIGHLLTAAGSASLIKVLLALKHNRLPATANFRQPAKKIPLSGSPFQILQQSKAWERRDATTPRRAAINGFGFGGINAHVLIEEWLGMPEAKNAVSHPFAKSVPVAIVGMSASVGRWPTLKSFQERVLGGGESSAGPKPSPNLHGPGCSIAGFFHEDIAIPVNRYRIPPKELAELLPQQALMLEAARSALGDAQPSNLDPTRTGVFVGLGLDLRTTDFHLRWASLAGQSHEPKPAADPLNADRTMGALAGINASRIAKEFRFGGPSQTVCSEDCSGIRALEIAVRALQKGEVDQALTGAVELTNDLRTLLATDAVRPFSKKGTARPFDVEADGWVPGEGAVALVLKRLEDARRDGDRVYAVIRGIGKSSESTSHATELAWGDSNSSAAARCSAPASAAYRHALERAYQEAGVDPASVCYVEANGSARPEEDRLEALDLDAFFGSTRRKTPCRLGSASADVGHTGAASGLVSVVKASLALYQEILPAIRGLRQPLPELAGCKSLSAPSSPQYWLRNRAEGPRRAGVSSSSIDGNCMHVVLEACEGQANERLRTERIQPLGARPETLFAFRGKSPSDLLNQLETLRKTASAATSLKPLAREFYQQSREDVNPCALALIAQDAPQLQRLIDVAAEIIRKDEPSSSGAGQDRDRIFYSPLKQRICGKLAFVFPGAGSYFEDMGRELALYWPEILRAQDRENQFLASQMFVDSFWNATSADNFRSDHRAVICGQVSLGSMVSDLARSFEIYPDASIGYSLGESTGLFALRAWKARDEMLSRVSSSPLFAEDLTGTPENLLKVWQVPEGQSVQWKAGLVDRSASVVRKAISGNKRLYVLIVNTPNECVIGGDSTSVDDLVKKLGCHWFPLQGVSTVHCELLRPFVKPYREMHLFDTVAPAGVQFFSGGWGRTYTPDRDTAADAIVAQASDCIDFPRVIRAAYDSGVRFFIEMGPGNSCSRMVGQILESQPHLARSLCASAQEPVLGVLRVLGDLFSHGVSVNLSGLYELEETPKDSFNSPVVRIPIVSSVFRIAVPAPVGKTHARTPENTINRLESVTSSPVKAGTTNGKTEAIMPAQILNSGDPFETEFLNAMAQSQAATLSAHQAYLNFSQGVFDALSRTVEAQMRTAGVVTQPPGGAAAPPYRPKARLDREACLEFAIGSVAKVLGPEFIAVDSFPTRVRLPDEPLMLVDRILEIEGEPRSMTHGRVVTEHDILPGAWYLDGNRIPTCIAVEAGQADLFLSGYLGIDFHTEGRAVYRLLDAKVCFHRGLAGPGEVIHYDIHINHFFRQGNTWLFRFNFEATVDGQPLLTMTDGCAGFFSEAALAGGKGVVRTTMDLKPMPGKRAADWEDFVPMAIESYSSEQLDALREGNFGKCFGPQFGQLQLQQPVTLPSGRMKLVHRIAHLDPVGGRFGLGLIRGEADIRPSDWFLICHFVDDRVMPGTLMFECCLHTLRVFLLRMGWVAEQSQTILEPVPGIVSQLKCRGQVLESTKTVTYEVSIKEVGYRPEPYVIADALMYADGKPIVEITNMSLRYAGVTRQMLRDTWSHVGRGPSPVVPGSHKPAIYGPDRILAYAIGKPSEAFGAPYEIFDEKRRIARLPGPPYMFLDRITEVHGEPFKMVAGCAAEAQYDIPADAWYFAENRQGDMPFAVLLEIALQPCGWLAAYAGSGLTSDVDVSFRNLGGKGTQFAPVLPTTGTLTTRVKMTRVSSSAGMIIQWFDLEVRADSGLIYKGDTYFGFFPKAALAKQEGIKDAALYRPSDAELARAKSLAYPAHSPFVGDQLRMVDQIASYIPDGGPQKLGFIRATKKVVPGEWFFKAHFYQDPVVPGSLGLESFLQLLKFLAIERWGHKDPTRLEAVAIDQPHEWVYRGQIIPTDHQVTIEVVVTAVDEEKRLITADGFLSVDGRVIYGLKNFTVQQK